MNYSEVITELNKASSFDLYRLKIAISLELSHPKRIDLIKRQLEIGKNISYFDAEKNCLIDAKVIEIRRTRCLIENSLDGNQWLIAFSNINLDNVDTNIRTKKRKLGIEKNELKVGDKVGFKDHDNHDVYGIVMRLNPKTVTLEVSPKQKWRVAYSLLFFVFEGEQGFEKAPLSYQN